MPQVIKHFHEVDFKTIKLQKQPKVGETHAGFPQIQK
jgi:hypothetical protein